VLRSTQVTAARDALAALMAEGLSCARRFLENATAERSRAAWLAAKI
jgi:hypothetical protein